MSDIFFDLWSTLLNLSVELEVYTFQVDKTTDNSSRILKLILQAWMFTTSITRINCQDSDLEKSHVIWGLLAFSDTGSLLIIIII